VGFARNLTTCFSSQFPRFKVLRHTGGEFRGVIVELNIEGQALVKFEGSRFEFELKADFSHADEHDGQQRARPLRDLLRAWVLFSIRSEQV